MDYSSAHSRNDAPARQLHPQQHGLTSASITAGVVRSVPPTAHRQTPSQRSSRSLPQVTFDSPFVSPPPTAAKKNSSHSARQMRTTPQQPAHYRVYDSPFQSPPSRNLQRSAPQPLVLDPSLSRQSYGTSPASIHTPQAPLTQQFLQVATGRIRDQLVVKNENMGMHASPAVSHPSETAAGLARGAPKAGFLQKLGRNIPEFKRRFFVLKAETNLYYYLSPNDLDPRGKISLEGTQVKELEQLPDGRFRFVVQDDEQRIVLEARTEDLGREWMQQLQDQRVSTLQARVDKLSSIVQQQKFQVEDLERQVEDFKLVEKDRDGAIEDARQWKDQFERLDDALRLLTQRMRQPPSTPKSRAVNNEAEVSSNDGEEKKEADIVKKDYNAQNVNESLENSKDGTPIKNNQSRKKEKDLPTNILDTAFHAVDENVDAPPESIEEIMSVPGIYFSGLVDACQQQRDSLQLVAEEAATAVEDVQEAQIKVDEMKKRMGRAEKHLTKLWEENCTIRKSLKQKKREKRVLIREYKTLQQTNQDLEERLRNLAQQKPKAAYPRKQQVRDTASHEKSKRLEDTTLLGSDGERLIDELEEHVASSIQLHERLARNTFLCLDSDTELNTSVDNSEVVDEEPSSTAGVFLREKSHEQSSGNELLKTNNRKQPITPASATSKLTSLMDDDDSSDEDAEEENGPEVHEDDDDGLSVNEYQSIMSPSIVSSVGAEFGSVTGYSHIIETPVPQAVSMDNSTPERPNPVLGLDEDDTSERQLFGSPAQPQRIVFRQCITDNVPATSKLSCPLADVVEPRGYSQADSNANAETAVYHLTFYSKKIGIQFQKAPPGPTKPKGLLTAAMTSDLTGDANGSDKTVAELRNVAAISSLARGRNAENEDACPVSLPKDAVLVCGFEGFDESGNNKPKLGARLVAFDGVSVEIGPWTFEAIRNAIKSRGRPLTLSFRNDYLTTEQRAVLTKAVMEVEAKRPPSQRTIDIGMRPPSATQSITSALTHDTDFFVNDEDSLKGGTQDLSSWAQEKECCDGRLATASHSVSAQYGRLRRMSSSSHSTHQGNFRSFSDAGSSISSTFAPLVSKLVKQASERRREEMKFTPQYLKKGVSLETTPQHQDFQSNLL